MKQNGNSEEVKQVHLTEFVMKYLFTGLTNSPLLSGIIYVQGLTRKP